MYKNSNLATLYPLGLACWDTSSNVITKPFVRVLIDED